MYIYRGARWSRIVEEVSSQLRLEVLLGGDFDPTPPIQRLLSPGLLQHFRQTLLRLDRRLVEKGSAKSVI